MGSAFGRITEEQPSYATIRTADEYEIRRYEPCCVIETSYASSAGMVSGDQGTSFMALARYIGVLSEPANERREKIDMTAPVFMTTDGAASDTDAIRYVMRFVLPKSMFATAQVGAGVDARACACEIWTRASSPFDGFRDACARTPFDRTRRFYGRLCAETASRSPRTRRASTLDTIRPWTPPVRTNEVMIEVSP